MKLGIQDRIILLNVLPAEGDVTTLRIIRKLKEDLGFTEKELKENEIISTEGKITWKPSDYQKDVQIGEKASDLIKDSLTELSKQKKLQEMHLNVYDLFVK
jgi:uncharacterized protein YjaG (DUF416 family)